MTAGATRSTNATALRRWLPWVISGLAIAAAAVLGVRVYRAPAPVAGVVIRSRVELKDLSGFVALSRDGRRLVYRARAVRKASCSPFARWISSTARTLPAATADIIRSSRPDGRCIAYGTEPYAGARSRRSWRPAANQSPWPMATWGRRRLGDDDTIVFSGPNGLMRVPSGGGTPEAITTLDTTKQEIAHQRPQFLPGRGQILFTVLLSSGDPQFAVLDLARRTTRMIASGGDNGRYVPSGHLTFVRSGTCSPSRWTRAR